MKPRRRAVVVTGIVTAALLVPALIWSGMRVIDAETRDAHVKLPEVSTIGAETIPYVLTPAEREKLALPAVESAIPMADLRREGQVEVVGSVGPYPGPTAADLEKLAAWQARVREMAAGGTPTITTPEREPVSTIEIVPRAPGIEGLTPAERAKLDAYLREGGRR